MIQIQLNITTKPDGTVLLTMDKLEREDVTLDERELAKELHDLLGAVMLTTVQQVGGPDSTMTMIDADGAHPVDWRNGWISVEERLPEKTMWVLMGYGDVVEPGSFATENELFEAHFQDLGGDALDGVVEYWMPFPPPPSFCPELRKAKTEGNANVD